MKDPEFCLQWVRGGGGGGGGGYGIQTQGQDLVIQSQEH